MASILGLLVSGEALDTAQFLVTREDADRYASELHAENEYADFFGQMVLASAWVRSSNALGLMCGVPKKLYKCLSGDPYTSDKTIKEIKMHWSNAWHEGSIA